jgi:AcrR family transcriptional regulator
VETAVRKDVMEAVLLALAREGYEELSVERALAEAGVSESEFEAEFGSKDECLFAAYDELIGRVVGMARGGCEPQAAWPARVREALARVLEAIAARPEMARAATRSFPAIRPDAYQRYVAFLDAFAALMREGREYSEASEELPEEVELLAVGAAESIIFTEVDAGRSERLPRMMPEILFSVLVPFMGPKRAGEEMRSAAAGA